MGRCRLESEVCLALSCAAKTQEGGGYPRSERRVFFTFMIYREKARVIYLQTTLQSSIAGGVKTYFDRKSSNSQYLETHLLFVSVA